MAREIADIAARVHGTDHWTHRNARFEVAVWTLYCGDRHRAVQRWRDLAEDEVTENPAGVEDCLRNITAVLNELVDPAFNAQLVQWLEALAESACTNRGVEQPTPENTRRAAWSVCGVAGWAAVRSTHPARVSQRRWSFASIRVGSFPARFAPLVT
ncbi:hypothetical protein amrb99_54450 [Actinomadura sp. RB99]|nr:hypothetical protein [Actinomadura sp. RB99]